MIFAEGNNKCILGKLPLAIIQKQRTIIEEHPMSKSIKYLKNWNLSLIICIFFLCISSNGHAFDVTLQWDEDTHPDNDGYKVYYDTDSGDPYSPDAGDYASEGAPPISVASGVTEITLTGLTDTKVYYFVVTSLDDQGRESDYSNEVSSISISTPDSGFYINAADDDSYTVSGYAIASSGVTVYAEDSSSGVTTAILTSGGNGAWSADFDVTSFDEGTVTIYAVSSGVTSEVITGTYDKTAPTVSLSYSPTGPYSSQSTNIVVTATFTDNNNISGTPTIAIDYNGGGSDISNTGMISTSNKVWTYTIATIPSGADVTTGIITIAANDVAGNSMTDSTNSISIDNSFTITTPNLPASIEAGGTLNFDAEGSSGGNYQWTFSAGSPTSSTSKTPSWQAPGSVASSPQAVTVTLIDPDSNLTTSGTVNVYTSLAVSNKPSDPPEIEAGSSSESFSASGGDGTYTWTVSGPVAVTGGTGTTYTFVAPSTGDFAGEYTVTVTDGKGFDDSFTVYVPIVIDPDSKNFTETMLNQAQDPNPQNFTVTGANTDYSWEIMESMTATTAVTNPDVYGTWSNPGDNTNIFTPADVSETMTFYVRVTVTGDADLTDSNGLNKRTTGPFRVIPVDLFTVTVTGNSAPLQGAVVAVDYENIGTQTTDANGEAVFVLPDVGSKYKYSVTAPAGWIDTSESSTQKTIGIALEQEGDSELSGVVQDTAGTSLDGATIKAFKPSDVTKSYTDTSVNGDFSVVLPVGASNTGWSVVASKTNYESRLLEDQESGVSVLFTGNYETGNGLQQKTDIIVADPVLAGTAVRLDITADPAFTAISQFDIEIVSGTTDTPLNETYSGGTVSVTYDSGVTEDFIVAIKADTSENNDPSAGYYGSYAYSYVAEGASAQGSLGVEGSESGVSVTANAQTSEVSVPEGGVIKEATITIKQVAKTNTTSNSTNASPTYVYEITALDSTTGLPLEDTEINYLEITIPIDLSVVSPGDLESGVYVIYQADNQVSLEGNEGFEIPTSRIISTDYVGDGQTGSVTFWVDHLSSFGVGAAAGGGGSLGAAGGGGGCFISSVFGE